MNLKILLLEPNDSLRDIIVKTLEMEFGAAVTSFKNTTSTIERLSQDVDFDLFIVRNKKQENENDPGEDYASIFLNTIYDLQIKTPLIVIGNYDSPFKRYAQVPDNFRIEELSRAVLNELNLKKEDFLFLKFPDYISFPIKYFYLMTICPCDVYIKLTKKTGDEFVKRLRLGESFAKSNLEKYEELGLQEFYVLKADRETFINGLFMQSLKSLRSSTDQEQIIKSTGDAFFISSDIIKTLGINPVCVGMVDQTLQQIKNQISKTTKLGQLLKNLLNDQSSYSYRRSFLISIVSYTLIPKMDWGGAEQQNTMLEKITMVSFFHDIFLEEEKYLKIMDQESLKTANLLPDEKDLVLNHAHRAAFLIQSYPKVLPGVDLILKQHHGVTNGIGFPEVLTSAISPMAIFFIVVEDFVTNLLEFEDESQLKNIISKLKIKYQLPSYRKIINEIENVYIVKK